MLTKIHATKPNRPTQILCNGKKAEYFAHPGDTFNKGKEVTCLRCLAKQAKQAH